MASHLSSIGFSVASEEAFVALAEKLAEDATFHRAPGGGYLLWRDDAGVEVWLPIDEENQIVGFAPHLSGTSRLQVGLTARPRNADDEPLDGRFVAWVNPPGEDPEEGAYPLVFECPDFACHSALALPATAEVQIVAFAGEVEAFPTLEAYESREGEGPQLAAQAFIPAGMFTEDFEQSTTPEAIAVLSGHVRESETRRNGHSGKRFHYALVESLEATFDVVVDPELLPEPPAVGGVLAGTFWLSGRLLG